MVLFQMCSWPTILGILVLSTVCSAKSIRKRDTSPNSSGTESANTAVPMSTAQADFALQLLRNTDRANEPLILSPFSIAVALSVAYLGSDGNTKKEMNALLAKGNSDEKLHGFITKQLGEMASAHEGYTLTTANRLYVDKEVPIKDTFVALVKEKYAGALQKADFNQPDAVSNEINRWVEGLTNKKIKKLVSPSVIKPDSKLVIANAVYFKGDWEREFDKDLTQMKPFYAAEDSQRQVEIMSRMGSYLYHEDGKLQLLGLEYKGEDVKMFIFLPVEKFGLSNFLEGATGQTLLDYMNKAILAEVQVEMPKFKLEKEFELSDVLQKLGVKDAFSVKANFFGICEKPLYISKVIHKAFVEVNEKGTEAAGGSAVMFAAGASPVRPPNFIADHPFMFAIVKDKSLLFVGKYA